MPATVQAFGFSDHYTYNYTYDSAEHVTSTTDPAAGSLAAETIATGAYNTFGDPGNVTSSSGATYISSRAYDSINRPTNLTFGSATGSNDPTRSFSYDTPSQLLAGEVTDIQTTPSVTHVQNDAYQYDHDFNIIKITDALNGNQNQCFNIDDYQRLSQAWTTLDSTCSDYGTPNNGSTTNPYKIQYNYDSVGRTTSIVTTLPTASTDTLSRGDTQTPFGIAATSNPSNTYAYDADGQQTTRNISGQPNATLTWTPDNLLRSYAPTAGGTPNTTYRYDADGNRILRQENGTSSSTTTLYLDNTELSSTSGTVTATRYLTDGGTTIGYINSGGVNWLVGNNQNSASYSTLAHSTTFQSEQYLPTGGLRGTSTLTGTEHDFLNKTQDPQTGLDQLGARYYDPTTTNFISVDPVAPATPNSINPYSYANLNPTTLTDPTGLSPLDWVKDNIVDPLVNEGQATLGSVKTAGVDLKNGLENFVGGGRDALKNLAQQIIYALRAIDHALDCWIGRSCSAYNADQSRAFEQQRQMANAIGGCLHSPARCAGAVVVSVLLGKAVDGLFGSIVGSAEAPTAATGVRSLTDLESLKGASIEEIRSLIPQDWTEMPLRKGEGLRFLNPNRNGEAFMIELGDPNAAHPLHSGPYLRISMNGEITRIPLAGNPTLDSSPAPSGRSSHFFYE